MSDFFRPAALVPKDGQQIEAKRPFFPVPSFQVYQGGAQQVSPFGGGDRLQRMPEGQARSGADFHEDQEGALLADQVQFSAY